MNTNTVQVTITFNSLIAVQLAGIPNIHSHMLRDKQVLWTILTPHRKYLTPQNKARQVSDFLNSVNSYTLHRYILLPETKWSIMVITRRKGIGWHTYSRGRVVSNLVLISKGWKLLPQDYTDRC